MSTATRIRTLAESKLSGRKIDIVGFVDELLTLAAKGETVHCFMASNEALRFELSDGDACEVLIDSGRGKLRMLCARLSALCNDTAAGAVSPYGGEGIIRSPASDGRKPHQWKIAFKNTPGEHEFTIVSAMVEAPSLPTAR